MIRRTHWLLFALLLCVPVGVRAQCVMANTLSQVHALQFDLSEKPDDPLASNVIQFIAGQMGNLQDDDLSAIADIHPSQGAYQVFKDFVGVTEQLLQAVETAGIAALPQHFAQDQVRANLRVTGQYLVSLGCIPRTAVTRPGEGPISMFAPTKSPVDATAAEVDVGEETPVDGIKRYLATPSGAISSVLAIVGACVAAFLIRTVLKRRRRRARRFGCHYATRFRIAGQDGDGVILDVSGMGIKLRRNTDQTIDIGAVVDVLIMDEWHAGTVAWENPHYVGVLFRQALRQRVVRALAHGSKSPVAQPT